MSNNYYTGKNSVDVWGNTSSDGSGTPTQIKVDSSGELQVDVLSSALPSGAATATNQTGGSQKTQVVDAAGDIANVTTDGALQIQDRFLAIAKGEVTGHSLMLKFGRNPDIDTAAEETVWEGGGTYTFDATAQNLEIVSSSTDDDGDPAGTGAQTVTVIGLDANYAAKTETVTMNGTNAVALTGTWLRVHRCSVTTAGSGGVNAGTLTVRIASGGATRLVVGANNGQTLMAVYTIPAGYTGYMIHYYASANAAATAYVDARLFTKSSTGVINLKHQQAIVSGYFDYKFGAPFKITEKTDIYLNASSSANNTDVCGGFDIVLVAN